jgi:iron complex transport system ATP-binding protein
MILVKNLACGYHGKVILQNINGEFKRQITVVLGANGAGKSTFLKTIAGLQTSLAGSVEVHGANIGSLPIEATAELMAWVSQTEKLEFDWTVEEYVAIARTTRSKGIYFSEQDRLAVNANLKLVECTHLATRSVLELSGGEMQRVRIARGLAQESKVIILDEPTAHLDIPHQVEIIALIQKLAREGKHFVISLHDLNQAIALDADFVMIHDQQATVWEGKNEMLESKLLNQVYGNSIEQWSRADGSIALVPTYTTGLK